MLDMLIEFRPDWEFILESIPETCTHVELRGFNKDTPSMKYYHMFAFNGYKWFRMHCHGTKENPKWETVVIEQARDPHGYLAEVEVVKKMFERFGRKVN